MIPFACLKYQHFDLYLANAEYMIALHDVSGKITIITGSIEEVDCSVL